MEHFIKKGEEFIFFTNQTIDLIYSTIAEEVRKNKPLGPACLGCIAIENVILKNGQKCVVFIAYNGFKIGHFWDLGIHKA